MKSKEKFSVIIRCRNEENWIGHCIQSVIDNFDDPEINVVNNGVVEVVGGVNENGPNGWGSGGMGRIRVDCSKNGKEKFIDGNRLGVFRPKIGCLKII